MELKDLINEKTTFIIDRKDRYAILEELSEKAMALGNINDREGFIRAVKEREALISTGIGFGVAIPHVKMENLNDFFIISAILKKPADWDSIDHKPVKIAFLIGCPKDRHTDYLKLLAQIMIVVKNNEKRKKLINAGSVEEFLSVIFN